MESAMIVQGNWKNFLTLRGEQLLLVQRKHLYILIAPVIATIMLSVLFGVMAYLLFIHLFFTLTFFVASILLIGSLALAITSKIIIDWYFHLYIVTSRRILELCYTPFSSLSRNDILLDRVNCTEIDVQTHGVLGELMDIGDIAITFDRPTHQEAFVLRDIKGCNEVGIYLTQRLLDEQTLSSTFRNPIQTIWMHQPGQAGVF